MAKPDSQWYRLDNAGILYSALQREEYSAIYRFSALMTEPVRPAALQNAIDRVLPRFPSFAVRIYTAAGFPTLRISAETGEGLEELIPLITGKLSAFTGNSGVGKSSILNALDPAFQLKTGEISTAMGRGRHTTRHVELFRLSCGAEIMDSPGFSSFETEELNLELKHRLPETFREFRPYL